MSDLLLILGGIFAAVLAFLRYGQVQKREGKKDAERDAMQDAYEREARGREAVRDGRDSGKSADKRVHDNDRRW